MENQDMWPSVIGCALWAYIIGSANLTIVSTRLLRLEGLRETGSQNPGVTNLFRAAGTKVAVPVLLLELFKAYVAFIPVCLLGFHAAQPLLILPFILGNLFPLFHGFRGGKGVAALVGAMLFSDVRVMLIGGVVFLTVFALFRRVSAGSLSMALSYPALIYLFHGTGVFFDIGLVLVLVIVTTHRANIKRLLRGEEPRLARTKT